MDNLGSNRGRICGPKWDLFANKAWAMIALVSALVIPVGATSFRPPAGPPPAVTGSGSSPDDPGGIQVGGERRALRDLRGLTPEQRDRRQRVLDRIEWAKERAGKAIPVFESDTRTGEERVNRMKFLARHQDLLLLDSAVFDPVRDGEPDFGAFLPGETYRSAGRSQGSYYIVQLKGSVLPYQRAAIESAGARIINYLPNNAYVVRMSSASSEIIGKSAFVRWQGRFRPGYKVHSKLMREATGLDRSATDQSDIRLLVALFPEEDVQAAAQAFLSMGIVVNQALADQADPVLEIEAPPSRLLTILRSISAEESVSWIQRRPTYVLNNANSIWVCQNYDTVNGPTEAAAAQPREYPLSGTIWSHDILGTNQVVAVADSGLDRDACQYRDAVTCPIPSQTVAAPGVLTLSPAQRKLLAYNVLLPATVGDESLASFHGSHTTGSVAGDNLANASTPTTAASNTGDGMAPQAKLLFEDVGDSTGGLPGIPIREQDLWQQERDGGGFISSNSWGVPCATKPCGDYDYESKLNDRFIWENQDFILLFSAGNDGATTADGSETHADKNDITVGATTNGSAASRADALATYSSRGPTADGRFKPDVMAPGDVVVSTSGTADPPSSPCSSGTCLTKSLSGTSMACPTAAGMAALMRQYFMEGWYPTGAKVAANAFTPSAALMKSSLINGAMNMVGASTGGDSPNNDQGWGRVHLDNVLYFSGDARKTRLWDVPTSNGLSTGDLDVYTVKVNTGTTLKVTLVWTDPPAVPYGSASLVNNLDLEVVGPTGTIYRGNSFTDGAGTNDKFSTANAAPDTKDNLNNVETVLLASGLSAGTYTVRVRAANVPGAGTFPSVPTDPTQIRQGYAVVVTGGLDLAGGVVTFSSRSYGCGSSSLTVNVFDDTAGAPSNVALTCAATGDSETISVSGTRPNYSATVPIDFNAAVSVGDGRLQVGDQATVTATYIDASPAYTSTATTQIRGCAPSFAFKSHTFSGGCDSDKYLDANETANLAVTLRNEGVNALTNVQGVLTTSTAGVVIGTGTVNFGSAAPGAVFLNSTPFVVSAQSVTAGTAATFNLSLTADGFNLPATISFTSYLEQDVVTVTNQTVSYTIPTSGVSSDISPPCVADRNNLWTTFDATTDPAESPVAVSTCDAGAPSAPRILSFQTVAGACGAPIGGTCGSYADEKLYEAQSPWINITPSGSTFVSGKLKQYTYSFRSGIPTTGGGGSPITDFWAVFFIDPVFDFMFEQNSYTDKSSTARNNSTWQSTTVDLTAVDVDDLTQLDQVGVEFYLDTRDTGNNATGSLRFDSLSVTFDAEGRKADVSACSLPCTAPATPTGVAASAISGAVHVQWNLVAGAGEYHLYRSTAGCGGPFTLIAEPSAGTGYYVDSAVVSGTTYTYKIRSADASGACESADSLCSSATASSGTCTTTPTFAGAASASSNGVAACGNTVSWVAGTSNCGGALTYRVYRSISSPFGVSPGSLLVSGLAGTSYSDPQVASLVRYYYTVRAVDSNGNEDGNTVVVSALTSGTKTNGSFTDDAETSGTMSLAVPWTRSTNQKAAGTYSYRSGSGPATQTYPSQTCGALTTPEIELWPTGTPTLSFWNRYQFELNWDGLVVEVATQAGGFADWTPLNNLGSATNWYPSTFSATGVCAASQFCPGQTYCNQCCYSTTQGAFTGGAGTTPAQVGPQTSTNTLPASYNGKIIKIRWNFSSDPGANFEGMYVDTISLSNVALPTACTSGTCTTGPTFYGLTSAVDLNSGANTGVRLTWVAPSSWGSGTPGNMLVYRNGVLLATLAAATTQYDDTVGNDGTLYSYQVVAVNSCGTRDGNSIIRTAADCTVSNAAVDGATLRVTVVGGQVHLDWGPSAITGANPTRVHWVAGGVTASCGAGSVWNSSVGDVESPGFTFNHPTYGDGQSYYYSIGAMTGSGCAEVKGAACP